MEDGPLRMVPQLTIRNLKFTKKVIYFLDNTCTFNNLMRSLKTKLLKYLILCAGLVASVLSDSPRPYGPCPARLLCPWDSPGKNTGVGCHFLLQRNITLNYKKQLKCKQDTAICHGLLLYSHSSHVWLCDPMDWSTPGFLVLHHLLEFAQTHVHSRWCHATMSSSVVPFSSRPQSFPASVFSSESALRIKWPKYWTFSFNISPSNEYSGLISFRTDWFDLFAVQGTLKKSSLEPQFKSFNFSVLSLLYGPTLTSKHDYWKNHTYDYMDFCQQGDVSAF